MMQLGRTLLITAVLMVGAVSLSLAQEEADLEFTYGTVVSISGDQVVISVYDYEMDAEAEVTYQVDDQTVYDGIASLAEVAAGDEVDIEYVEQDGVKLIKNLYKSFGSEGDDMGGEMMEE